MTLRADHSRSEQITAAGRLSLEMRSTAAEKRRELLIKRIQANPLMNEDDKQNQYSKKLFSCIKESEAALGNRFLLTH